MPQIPETSLPEYYASQTSEEYIDYIVQTRMADVHDKLGEMEEKIKDLSKRLDEMGEKLSQAAENKASSQQQGVISRIEEFSETFSDIDSRVGSLEKAFKDTLPALIGSVRSLSDVVQKMKKEA
jgi:prefoldin subunit 5